MEFVSVLWDRKQRTNAIEPPECLSDLQLERMIEFITAPKRIYNLKPFYYTPLHDVETIYYRQEVMKDLENDELLRCIKLFSDKMLVVHRYMKMTEKLDYEYNQKGWFLEAVLAYCDTVSALVRCLNEHDLKSRGMIRFREYLNMYFHSRSFQSMLRESKRVKEALSNVKYCVIIGPAGKVSVKRYNGEPDYSVELEKVFTKFKEKECEEDYSFEMRERYGMTHVEAKILEFVVRLYPEPFSMLDRFYDEYNDFLDDVILTFEREIQFYIAYLEFIDLLKQAGLPFCYPEITDKKHVDVRGGFDIALAHFSMGIDEIILNDFYLIGSERVIVVSGPNQGGKTTFARMFGQLHYFASLGLLVPARRAKLALFDQIFTHFEREENVQTLRSKLEDDLVRIHNILDRASSKSIIILNEIFSSTTLSDGITLSKKILEKILELDCLCVWVTFLDELSQTKGKVVSMVSTVNPYDPTIRTFKIIRKPADGLAYAVSLLEKYDLTHEKIKERVQK